MKINAAWDLQLALWRRLSAHPDLLAVLGGPRLYDDVPQTAAFPFVTLGDIRSTDWSTQDQKGHEHILTLHAWSRAKGRKQVQAILQVLEAALDDAALALQAHRLINLRLVFWDARRELDGETYHGLMRFRAVTEPIV